MYNVICRKKIRTPVRKKPAKNNGRYKAKYNGYHIL